MKLRDKALLFAGAAALSILFYPAKIIVAPEWDVRVIDSYGRPASGANVRGVWEEYSVENESHEEDRVAGGDGTVHFPLRTMRSSIALRFTGCFANILAAGVHASCGGHAYLVDTKGGMNYLKSTGDSWSGVPRRIAAAISY
jgi:hypothetical protein